MPSQFRYRLSYQKVYRCACFFFNDTATTEIYTLSLHDALPISQWPYSFIADPHPAALVTTQSTSSGNVARSEEHTSELQSQSNLVCRLLLEKKKLIVLRAVIRTSTRQMSFRSTRCGNRPSAVPL